MTTRNGGREIVVGMREVIVGALLLVVGTMGSSFITSATAVPLLTDRVDHLEEKWEALFIDVSEIKSDVKILTEKYK